MVRELDGPLFYEKVHGNCKTVVIENRETGEVITFPSRKRACQFLGIQAFDKFIEGTHSKNVEYKLISVGDKKIEKAVQDRIPTFERIHHRGRKGFPIKLRNKKTGEITSYPSMDAAAKAFGLFNASVFNFVKKGGTNYPYSALYGYELVK